jgi:hypothetical protein
MAAQNNTNMNIKNNTMQILSPKFSLCEKKIAA